MQSTADALIEAAIEWAEAGVPVFPTGDDKRPLTENGFYDASLDPDTITTMFEQAGNRLHGIGGRMGAASGLFAVDADTYKPGEAGEAAKAYIRGLETAGMLPATRVHATRNGGRHYLFRADEFPNCKPSKGVEVKGEGGYIVLPPSPGYTIESRGVVDAPARLVADLKASRSAQSATPLDALKGNILRGDDFHDSLTQLAAKMSSAGEPVEAVQATLLALMNASVASSPAHPRHDRWQPIMADRSGELSRIVGSGHSKYNTAAKTDGLRDAAPAWLKEMAALQFPPIREEMALVPIKTAASYGTDFPFAGSRGYFGHEQLDILTEEFIMHPIYHASEVTLISADPKAGKTLISQTLAMHIAAGLDFDEKLTVSERRPVLYFALESQSAIRKRLMAWKKYHDPSNTLYVDENTFPFFTSEDGMNLLDESARINLVEKIKAADTWWQNKGEKELGVVVIDTLTKAMPGGDQNSVEDTSAVFDIIAKIKDAGIKAAVVIIHHNTKNSGSPRGSSNIQAEPDTLLTVTKNEDTGNLEMRVLMARSIEDDQTFRFTIVTESLGTSTQGYLITAPVLLPAVVTVDEVDNSTTSVLQQEMQFAPMFEALAEYGPGVWPMKRIHALFKEKLAGTGLYDRATTQRPNTADLSAFLLLLFPTTGRNIVGGYNVVTETRLNRDNRPLIHFFRVKKLMD